MQGLHLWRLAFRPPERRPEEEFEQILRNLGGLGQRLRGLFSGGGGGGGRGPGGGGGSGKAPGINLIRWLPVIVIVAILAWLATGVYQVQPAEQGVVRTFGGYTATTASGLNYHFPWPIQTATIVDVESIRRAEIGYRTTADGATQVVLSEALMLTKDENIVDVHILIQYKVGDARAFTFNVQEPEAVLLTTAEVALRTTVGQMTFDAVTLEERESVQRETRRILVGLLADYGLGIEVTDVRLQLADPPAAVLDAFQEVVRARADKEAAINAAQAYQNDVVPKARGQATEVVNQAKAFQAQREAEAEGEADRFLAFLAGLAGNEGQAALSVYVDNLETARIDLEGEVKSLETRGLSSEDDLIRDVAEVRARGEREIARGMFALTLTDLTTREGYLSSLEVTRQRLYLETMERVLPMVRKFVLTPDAGGSLLQFLPLEEGATFPPRSEGPQ